ncbi:hypothetical protein B0H14DRAFT_2928368 [Mycena olivaceomarginata]|nr:hypothetical protein B0H14DRAFT_2928368 [Mycena olivaceomarginata]
MKAPVYPAILSVWARTRRCSSAFSSPCMTSTSASCAGTVSHGGCLIPSWRTTSPSSDICRRCTRETCCLTRRVRGRKRSCGRTNLPPQNDAVPHRDAALHCLLHPHEHFPRTRARPRMHLRVRIGRPRARARLPRLPSRLRAPLIPLRCRARLPPEKAQGQAQKRMRSRAAGAHSSRAPRTPRLRSPR